MQTLVQKLKLYNNVILSIKDISNLKAYFKKEIFSLIEKRFQNDDLHIVNNTLVRKPDSPTFINDYRDYVELLKNNINDSRQSSIETNTFGDHEDLFDYLIDSIDVLQY